MKIQEIATIIDGLVPLHLAESYDNVGLLVAEPENELTGILIALDVTPAVLQEALEKKANLIVTHHPIWFKARKNLIENDFVSKQIRFAIANKLNLYACHTNLDNIQNGVNQAIVSRLGLRNTYLIDYKLNHGPKSDFPAGTGMIGNLPEAIPEKLFLEKLKQSFGCAAIRFSSGPDLIQKVAVCGGAGDFLLEKAMELGADTFLTGDIGYHRFYDADNSILLVDLGHYESEQYTVEVIQNLIKNKVENIPILISEAMSNPVSYF